MTICCCSADSLLTNGCEQETVDIRDSNENPTILTLSSVAEYLRVHPSTIYRLLRKKQLPAFKLGRDWRFKLECIDRWRAYAERSRAGTRRP
jgi:excisionase family DNA binding protein